MCHKLEKNRIKRHVLFYIIALLESDSQFGCSFLLSCPMEQVPLTSWRRLFFKGAPLQRLKLRFKQFERGLGEVTFLSSFVKPNVARRRGLKSCRRYPGANLYVVLNTIIVLYFSRSLDNSSVLTIYIHDAMPID